MASRKCFLCRRVPAGRALDLALVFHRELRLCADCVEILRLALRGF